METPAIQHPHASWRDYYELGKPRVVMLIMFTAIAGMFLAAPGFPPPNALLFGTLGIAFAASAAAAGCACVPFARRCGGRGRD